MKLSPFAMIDFYKDGHRLQYPEGTTKVYSNETARSDKYFKGLPDFDHKIVNFGLQGVCKWLLIDLWNEGFFDLSKEEVVKDYIELIAEPLGKVDADTSHVEALHALGYLPISIKALPEGERVNIKVPTYTITETIPEFAWVVNYLETQLQSELWKAKVSATTAYEFRRLLDRYAEMTGADPEFVKWQGHDFSMRGMSGVYDAAQSGAGHLLSFTGTDTVPAIQYLKKYYGGKGLVGGSIPATEHAVAGMNIIDIEHNLIDNKEWNGLTLEMLQGIQPLPDFQQR